jgi:Na+/melibiose symporter-like transporter
MLWAVLCLVLFLVTFFTTRERIQPPPQQKSDVKADFGALIINSPWIVMALMTLFHFAMLSFRGGALYNYYHHYADKGAMFGFVQKLGLTVPADAPASGGFLDFIGYIVHGDQTAANVADVFNSIINMVGTGVTVIVILLSMNLSKKFGKKAVAVCGFSLSTVCALAFYFLPPTAVGGMLTLTIIGSIVYAPTIPLIWAIYADVADYSEWKTGRRFTGVVFATIMFALKCGLAFGSASFLWILKYGFSYDTKFPDAPEAVRGYRFCVGLCVAALFAACTILLVIYKLNKRVTIQMADELAERRKKFAAA